MEEVPLRKAVIAVFVAGLLAGPLSTLAQAGTACKLQEKLGIVNVKECESDW